MSRWSDQFKAHQIHQSLGQLKQWLDVEIEDIESEHEIERRRLSKFLSQLENTLSEVDPELFAEPSLTQMDQQLRQPAIWNSLNTYNSSHSVQHVRDANDHLTGQLQVFQPLLQHTEQSEVGGKFRGVEEAFDKFCVLLEKKEKEFSARLNHGEKMVAELGEIANRLKNDLQRLEKEKDQALSEWQSSFTSAQTSRAEEFSVDQINRGEKFDAALREWRDKSELAIKNISAEHEGKLSEAFKNFSASLEAKLVDAQAKHNDILEIHGLVGTDGVAGGYQKNATDEKDAAVVWRRVAMGSFIFAGLWLLFKYSMGFEAVADGSINWPEAIATTSLTLVFLGMGGYAARQSGMHREAEQHMRWFALEVNAIDPFLSSLPEDQRHKLKDQLSQKLFGQNRVSSPNNDRSIDLGALKTVTDAIQSVLKAAGRG